MTLLQVVFLGFILNLNNRYSLTTSRRVWVGNKMLSNSHPLLPTSVLQCPFGINAFLRPSAPLTCNLWIYVILATVQEYGNSAGVKIIANWIPRSSHRRCSINKGVLRNFAKFTGKHLCQSLFFNIDHKITLKI